MDEPNETFTVRLSNVSGGGATIGDATGTGTITDDDLPVVTVAGGGDVTEGAAAVFTLTRSNTYTTGTLGVTFTVTDIDGVVSGEAPIQATFPANEPKVTVEVWTDDDEVDEPDAVLTLELDDGDAYDLGAASTATVTVQDNEGTPALSVADASVSEGLDLVFELSLGGASSQRVTVQYEITPDTAQAADYTGTTRDRVIFEPGETSKEVTLDLVDDDLEEPEETVTLTLSDPQPPGAATLGRARATGTIEDDDMRPERPVTLTMNPLAKLVRYGVGDWVELVLPAATGGTGPYNYTLSPLPSGLSFEADTRVLSGTPDTPGLTESTYEVRDSAGSPVTGTLYIRIKQSMSMTLNPLAKQSYRVGERVKLVLPGATGGTGAL